MTAARIEARARRSGLRDCCKRIPERNVGRHGPDRQEVLLRPRLLRGALRGGGERTRQQSGCEYPLHFCLLRKRVFGGTPEA
jgi:hypothetical protein